MTIISIISSAAISFGSKTFSFYLVYLLPAHLTLDGTKWLVLAWKNFENDQKFLLLFLEYEKKNTCGGRGSGFFEIIRAAIIVQFQTFFHILRKWFILSDTFCRHILEFCLIQYIDFQQQSVRRVFHSNLGGLFEGSFCRGGWK